MSKKEDITNKKFTYRDLLRENYEAFDKLSAQVMDIIRSNPSKYGDAIYTPKTYDDNVIEGYEMSPLLLQGSYWGDSVWDDDTLKSLEDWDRFGDVRAENQPVLAKLGSALTKGVVLAGTTFLDGTIGLVTGVLQGTIEGIADSSMETFTSRIFNNGISLALDWVNNSMEEVLPNYTTLAYLEMSTWRKLGTADFWLDGVLKNMGFTVGALYSGEAWLAPFKATKLLQGAKMTQKIMGSTMSALNEGRIEALHTYNDINKNSIALADAAKQQKILEIAEDKSLTDDEKYLLINKVEQNYLAELLQIELQAAQAAKLDMILNIPILTIDNFFTYGKIFERGFRNANVSGTSNAIESAAKEASEKSWWQRLKDYRKRVNEASDLEDNFLGAAENVAEKEGKYVWNKITNKKAALKGLRSTVMEGNEEMAQKFASEFSTALYTPKSTDEYYEALTNPEANMKAAGFMEALSTGWLKSYGDGSSWDEFAMGAITGLVGVPTFGSRANSSANTWLGRGRWIGMSQGMIGEFNNARYLNSVGEASVKAMNDLKEKVNLRREGIAQSIAFHDAMEGYARDNDKFEFTNAKDNDLFRAITAFIATGREADLVDMINTDYANISDEELDVIAKTTTRASNINHGWRDGTGNYLSESESGRQQMREELEERKKETLLLIDSYKKAVAEARWSVGTNPKVTEDEITELAWLRWKATRFAERADKLREKHLSVINTISNTVALEIKNILENLNDSSLPKEERVKEQSMLMSLIAMYNFLNIIATKSSNSSTLQSLARGVAQVFSEAEKDGNLTDLYNIIAADSSLSYDDFIGFVEDLLDISRLTSALDEFNSKVELYNKKPSDLKKNRKKIDDKNKGKLDALNATSARNTSRNWTTQQMIDDRSIDLDEAEREARLNNDAEMLDKISQARRGRRLVDTTRRNTNNRVVNTNDSRVADRADAAQAATEEFLSKGGNIDAPTVDEVQEVLGVDEDTAKQVLSNIDEANKEIAELESMTTVPDVEGNLEDELSGGQTVQESKEPDVPEPIPASGAHDDKHNSPTVNSNEHKTGRNKKKKLEAAKRNRELILRKYLSQLGLSSKEALKIFNTLESLIDTTKNGNTIDDLMDVLELDEAISSILDNKSEEQLDLFQRIVKEMYGENFALSVHPAKSAPAAPTIDDYYELQEKDEREELGPSTTKAPEDFSADTYDDKANTVENRASLHNATREVGFSELDRTKPFHETMPDKTKEQKKKKGICKRLWEFMSSHNIFSKQNKLKVGLKVYFVIDDKLNEETGTFVVLLATDEKGENVIGDLITSDFDSYNDNNNLRDLTESIKREYESNRKEGLRFVYSKTSVINQLKIGYALYTSSKSKETDRTLNEIWGDSEFTLAISYGGNVFRTSRTGTKDLSTSQEDSIRGLRRELKPGVPVVLVPSHNGRWNIPVPFLMDAFGESALNSQFGAWVKESISRAIDMGVTSVEGQKQLWNVLRSFFALPSSAKFRVRVRDGNLIIAQKNTDGSETILTQIPTAAISDPKTMSLEAKLDVINNIILSLYGLQIRVSRQQINGTVTIGGRQVSYNRVIGELAHNNLARSEAVGDYFSVSPLDKNGNVVFTPKEDFKLVNQTKPGTITIGKTTYKVLVDGTVLDSNNKKVSGDRALEIKDLAAAKEEIEDNPVDTPIGSSNWYRTSKGLYKDDSENPRLVKDKAEQDKIIADIKDYEKAETTNTKESYAEYLTNHPEGECILLAKNKLKRIEEAERKQLELQQPQQQNTVDLTATKLFSFGDKEGGLTRDLARIPDGEKGKDWLEVSYDIITNGLVRKGTARVISKDGKIYSWTLDLKNQQYKWTELKEDNPAYNAAKQALTKETVVQSEQQPTEQKEILPKENQEQELLPQQYSNVDINAVKPYGVIGTIVIPVSVARIPDGERDKDWKEVSYSLGGTLFKSIVTMKDGEVYKWTIDSKNKLFKWVKASESSTEYLYDIYKRALMGETATVQSELQSVKNLLLTEQNKQEESKPKETSERDFIIEALLLCTSLSSKEIDETADKLMSLNDGLLRSQIIADIRDTANRKGKPEKTENGIVKKANSKLVNRIIDAVKFRKTDEGYQKADLQSEMKWLRRALPNLDNPTLVRICKGLIKVSNKPNSQRAWGMTRRGVMTISDMASRGTTFHEAFHSVIDLLLSDDEIDSLFAAGSKLYGIDISDDFSLLQIEESLAEDFRKYVQAEQRPIIGSIVRMYRAIKHGVLTIFRNQHVIDNMFYRINRGKLGNRQLKSEDQIGSRGTHLSEAYTEEMKTIKELAIANGTFMKAPNGKSTNLNERLWLLVRTKAFKEWFGDWEAATSSPITLTETHKSGNINHNLIKYDVVIDEEKIGSIDLGLNHKSKLMDVHFVKLDKKGNGQNLYRKLVLQFPGYTLQSDTFALSQDAINMWERLVKKGQAIKRGEKDYYMTNETIKSNVSKVVDENGEPLVVYHGDPERGYTVFNTTINPTRKGTYFSDDNYVARSYQFMEEDVYNTFLNIRNPKILDFDGGTWNYNNFKDTTDNIVKNIEDEYDGIIMQNIYDSAFANLDKANGLGLGTNYVILESNLVKSATDNVGTFSKDNDDIRYRLADEATMNDENLKAAAIEFLDNFDISINEIKDYNSDVPLFDALNRCINPRSIEDISEGTGYAVAFMMQHSREVLELVGLHMLLGTASLKGIRRSIRNRGEFRVTTNEREAKKLDKDSILKQIGADIAEQLRILYKVQKPERLSNYISKIIDTVVSFFNKLTPKFRTTIDVISGTTKSIADAIALNDPSIVRQTTKKPKSDKEAFDVDLAQAFRDNPYEENLISLLNKHGISLAGGASIAAFGTMYRADNPFHDLDFQALGISKELLEKILEKEFLNFKLTNIIDRERTDGEITHTYLVMDRPFYTKELPEVKQGVIYIFDKQTDTIIGEYINKKNDLWLIDGVHGKMLDFFGGSRERYSNKVINYNGKDYLISDYRNAMRFKVEKMRDKDIWDYANFVSEEKLAQLKSKARSKLIELKDRIQKAQIIWGHPAIGKTTYIQDHRDEIIEWDEEVNDERNEFIKNAIDPNNEMSPEDYKAAKSDYMINWKEHPEYVLFLTEKWNELVDRARRENKKLFASPTPLLEIGERDIDLFLAIDRKNFLDRNQERGGKYYSSVGWKQGVDSELVRRNLDKVFYTSQYFSDVMDNYVNNNVEPDIDEYDLLKGYSLYKLKYNNLSLQTRDAIDDAGIKLDEFEELSISEKENLLACSI